MEETNKNIDEAEEEIQEILKRRNLQFDYELKFPFVGTLPDEVILAQKILRKAGMSVLFILREEAGVKKPEALS